MIYCFPASLAFVFDAKKYAKLSTFRRPAVELREWREASPMSKYRECLLLKAFTKVCPGVEESSQIGEKINFALEDEASTL